MSKLYVLRLEAGFPAESRKRAGIYLVKGERLTTELTDEQLKAVKADEWISVKEADASVSKEDSELDIDSLKRKDLDLVAIELGLDPSDYKNLEELRPAVKEAIAKRDRGESTPPATTTPETTSPDGPEGGSEGGDDTTTPPADETTTPPSTEGGEGSDESDTNLPNLNDKTVDELELIAAELNLNVEKVENEDEYKAALVKAIEDAKPVEE